MHLTIFIRNLPKNTELKNLYQLMKDQCEFHGDDVRPVKATGTRWIDHKLQHAIPEIENSKDRSTLRSKFEKLIDAKVLRSLLLKYLASPLKNLISILFLLLRTLNQSNEVMRNYSKSSRPTPKQYLPIYQRSLPSSQKLREMRMENQSIKIRN